MKRLIGIILFLTSSLALAQVPHVTQPYFYLWDYSTVNIAVTPGFTQIAHFEIQLDAGIPVSTVPPIPISVAAVTPGFSTFKYPADAATPLGSHTFNVLACPTLTSSTVAGSGCVAAPTPFAFALDPKALPSAQRLGVGL